jgi:hypothetical protein
LLSRRGDRIVAGLLAAVAIAAALAARSDGSASGGSGASGSATSFRDPERRIEAQIPAGWRALERPINSVIYPPQALAAASYPVRVPRRPLSCHPGRVLAQMPPDGVLLQVFEYAPPARVPRFPPRPSRLSYAAADYGQFECMGPSYRFEFSIAGRAFQAHVWFDRQSADPVDRKLALDILASLRRISAARR